MRRTTEIRIFDGRGAVAAAPPPNSRLTDSIRGNGQKINANVNGCLNIGRKELGDEWLRKLLETDEGRLMRPIKDVRIFVF